jgi:predicted N-acyltransferase
MPGLNFNIEVAHGIHEISAEAWDELSGGRPFQSHRWYRYGEQVMDDCQPFYALAYQGSRLVGRAALWRIRNEPLPQMPAPLRRMLLGLFRIWPLLICRSPLAFTQGIVLANGVDPQPILSALAFAALDLAKKQPCSFVLFDYLDTALSRNFPRNFLQSSNPNPGTVMENRWAGLDDYLAAGNKKDRQHYKRTMREAGRLNIRIERHSRVENIDEALNLIRRVERNHGALPNPWARRMLERMEMVDGIYLTAVMGETLAGCGLLLEDNASQMTSALGLADDAPYAYFMLVYESLGMAFEHKVRFLRWGSGAYDVKERLGFSREDNGAFAFSAANPILQNLLQRLARASPI